MPAGFNFLFYHSRVLSLHAILKVLARVPQFSHRQVSSRPCLSDSLSALARFYARPCLVFQIRFADSPFRELSDISQCAQFPVCVCGGRRVAHHRTSLLPRHTIKSFSRYLIFSFPQALLSPSCTSHYLANICLITDPSRCWL